MRKYCLVVLMALAGVVWGQPPDAVWTYQYISLRSDYVKDIIGTDDGGIVLVIQGTRETGTANLAKLIKLDETGNEVWVRSYDTLRMGRCNAGVMTDDGGFLLVGGPDIYLLRTDREGIPLWTRQHEFGFLNSFAWDVVITSDGGFAILTEANYLLKTNSVGDTLWTRLHYASVLGATQTELSMMPDGGFMYSFTTLSLPEVAGQIGVARTDSNGTLEWLTLLGTADYDIVYSLTISPDGGCIVGGLISPSMSHPPYPLVARLNANGDSLWMHVFFDTDGGFVRCRALNVETTVLIGSREDDEHHTRLLLTGINGDGMRIWNTTFSIAADQNGNSLLIANENIFYAAGVFTDSGIAPPYVWVARYEFGTSTDQIHRIEIPTIQSFSVYPNPFNSTATLEFDLNQTENLRIILYDILGRHVMDLGSGTYIAGRHATCLDASGLPAGNYICRFQNRNGGISKIISLLK